MFITKKKLEMIVQQRVEEREKERLQNERIIRLEDDLRRRIADLDMRICRLEYPTNSDPVKIPEGGHVANCCG